MELSEYKRLFNDIPEQGRDIEVIDDNGITQYCFRCDCNSKNCMIFKDSITGKQTNYTFRFWKYVDYGE